MKSSRLAALAASVPLFLGIALSAGCGGGGGGGASTSTSLSSSGGGGSGVGGTGGTGAGGGAGAGGSPGTRVGTNPGALVPSSALTVALATNDIIYDPHRQVIYASLPSSAGASGNSIAAIDPATGAVGTPVFVGSEPGRLAISDDGQFLYVALGGAAAVRRVDLASMTAGLQFSLGGDPFFGPAYAGDIEVAPGDAHTVAISLAYAGVSPAFAGVALFVDGVSRTAQIGQFSGTGTLCDSIQFGATASRLYGFNNESTGFELSRMNVDASGITMLDQVGNFFGGFGVEIRFDGGRLYASSGAVADPEAKELLGVFSPVGGGYFTDMVSDAAAGRAFFLETGRLSSSTSAIDVFDEASLAPVGTIELASLPGDPSSLIRFGANGLAFRTTAGDVHLLTTTFEGPTASAPAGTVVSGASYSIGWTSMAGATAYRVDESTDASFATGVASATVGGTSRSFSHVVTTDTKYYYRIVATDAATGAASPAGNVVSVLVLAAALPSNVTLLSLPAKDLVYDPFRGQIYASLPSGAGALANCVTTIDPATGAIGASAFAGSEPGRLALSDDGQFLYVALDGGASVRRFDLATATTDIAFPLGRDSFLGLYYAQDLAVVPGSPRSVAVARMCPGFSAANQGFAIFDDGAPRANAPAGFATLTDSIRFGASASRLYAYDNEDTGFDFSRFTVDATGATAVDSRGNLIGGFGVEIRYDGGRVYATSGQVIDPEAGTLAGTFQLAGATAAMVPDSSVGRTFFVVNGAIVAYSQTTFTEVGSLALPSFAGNPASLVRFGTNGLALLTDAGEVYLVTTSLVR